MYMRPKFQGNFPTINQRCGERAQYAFFADPTKKPPTKYIYIYWLVVYLPL